MKIFKYFGTLILLVLSVIACDKVDGAENDKADYYGLWFSIVNDANVDFFNTNPNYYPDSVLLIDQQTGDSLLCINSTIPRHPFSTFYYYEINNYNQFVLYEEAVPNRDFPINFTLNYGQGKQDTLTILKNNVLINQKQLPIAGVSFPDLIKGYYLIIKS
jgi:hypothetical protein